MSGIYGNLVLFTVTTGLTCLIPGITAMTVASNGSTHGFRSVVATIAGIIVANTLFFFLVGLGVKTFIVAAPKTYKVIQMVGVAYMIYMGFVFVRASRTSNFELAAEKKGVSDFRSVIYRSFVQGFYIQAFNPKALLYYIALLPQFIIPKESLFYQLVIYSVITAVLDVIAYGMYGYLGTIIKRFELNNVSYYLKLMTGLLLIFLGVKMITV
ncbi:LysE family translocator [Candidatus Pantoea multigeneris]|uniref:LysE family translocator n=1 Tax=Candidatus Pantoea multigeneris TaxID=2608357 RepID=A0ABX0RDI3_9GAMM|nr:LysE family translocator [Pantoea multigeneris]NIF23420.1 LysE family translocator [Pantoea multigeneris]